MMKFETDARIQKMACEENTEALAHRVLDLQTSDKFRLAAALLDLGKAGVAEAVGIRACQEIQLAFLFAKPKPE